MTSSRPFLSSSSPPPLDEAPIAASFAATLRAFAQKEERARLRPSLAPAIAQKKALTSLGSLSRGPEKMANKKSAAPPAVPAAAEEPSPAENRPAAEKPSRAGKPSRPQSPPLLARAWKWLKKQNAFSAKKQLRVCETVSLGEKRFVAVVQIEGQKFLIGGGASGVSLLAELENETELDSSVALENNARPAVKAALERNLALDGDEIARVLQPIACAGGRSR